MALARRLAGLAFAVVASAALAQDSLPLPRFVSLKADEVYMRAGPGKGFPVAWVYVRKGLPLEVTAEDGPWRLVRDIDGAEGWIHRVMLSGARTVIVTGDGTATAYGGTGADGEPVFRAEPGAMGDLVSCDGDWCRVEVDGVRGWMPMSDLWGVRPGDGSG